ncbi:MAG: hypothetical protein LBK27_08930, partial [Treponema sp.]|nr:hypothetical protein [Treponema sp.]
AEVFNSRNTRTPGPAPAAERRTVSYRLNSAPAAGFGAGTLPSAGDVRRDRAASPVEAIRLTASASPGRAGPVPIDRNRADKAIPVPAPAEGRGDGIPGANENGVESPAGPPEPAPEYSHTPVPGFTAGGQAAGPPDSEAPGHPETPENGGRKAGSFLINPGLKPWIFSRNGKVRRRRRRDS